MILLEYSEGYFEGWRLSVLSVKFLDRLEFDFSTDLDFDLEIFSLFDFFECFDFDETLELSNLCYGL